MLEGVGDGVGRTCEVVAEVMSWYAVARLVGGRRCTCVVDAGVVQLRRAKGVDGGLAASREVADEDDSSGGCVADGASK